MKRWIAIGLLVSTASIGACGSGPDLAKNAPDVAIVDAASGSDCSGSCGFISGVALGTTGTYVMFDNQNSGNTLAGQLASIDFTSRSAVLNTWAPAATGNGVGGISTSYDIVYSTDHQLFWAGNPLADNTTNSNQVTVYSAAETALQTPTSAITSFVATLPKIDTGSGNGNDGGAGGIDGGTGSNPNNGGAIYLAGLAADPDAVYIEYAQDKDQTSQGGFQTTPDSQFFPGSTTPSEARDAAVVARIDRRAPDATPEIVSGFFLAPNIAIHVLAQNSTELYFPDHGQASGSDTAVRILAQAKSTIGTSTPTEIWRLPNSQSTTVVGLAANDTYVAWVTSTFQPVGGHAGCNIYASMHDGSAVPLSGSTNGPGDTTCSGLAIDDTYAYVAMTNDATPQNSGATPGLVTVGTGILRVPLAGGPSQVVSLQSQRWYGPRRVFVDDTFVYGIDPDFVARFPKTYFPQ